jgi:long-chain acyl-CoA synthetase
MEKTMLEKLKLDLKEAVAKKDYAKITQLREILNISDEQAKYFEKGLTGYPSIDKVWNKYYPENAEEMATNIPVDKTVWDVIEEKLLEYYDFPALVYFGREFSKQEFIDLCYTWARTFRAMGVAEDEVVPVYGPFVPDICAMVFGLNMIGATPYFLKLAISPEALEEETRDSKIAVVFDGMWDKVAGEFTKPKFKNVIVASAAMDMPSPKKQIVSFINKIQALKNHSQIPDEKKYIWADRARDIANYYSGEVKVPFKKDRSTFITSSSGTTVGGIVKGTVATNESTISQLYMGKVSGIQYYPGDKILTNFPPTASTSLNVLFLLALYCGEIIHLDPRVSEKDFYNQIMSINPNIALTTGSMWEVFFNRVIKEMQSGKKFDFSYAKGWTVGGEGTDVRKFKKWNELMQELGAEGIYSGYGSSELFSATCVEKRDVRYDYSKSINSVGIPYAGINMGVFDKDGNELSYNQRGELRIKSKSMMKEYYNKPEVTAKTKVDGWICTGDLAEIDEKGFIYIWGRVKDSIKLENGEELYLFDVANLIKQNNYIDDCIVLSMPTVNNPNNLVAHIVWDKDVKEEDKKQYLSDINCQIESVFGEKIELSAYSAHDIMLPYSPTTLKKDKNKLHSQTEGYVQVIDDKLCDVSFEINEDGIYTKSLKEKEVGKVLSLKR